MAEIKHNRDKSVIWLSKASESVVFLPASTVHSSAIHQLKPALLHTKQHNANGDIRWARPLPRMAFGCLMRQNILASSDLALLLCEQTSAEPI